MVTWVKRASAEKARRWRVTETLNRLFPMPFEERRSRVGTMKYKHYKFFRFLPYIVMPTLAIGVIAEGRQAPHETVLTPLHVWLADHGFFRMDSIKAVSAQGEQERLVYQNRVNDRKFFLTGGDLLSDTEQREFATINKERQLARRTLPMLLSPDRPSTGF